MAALLALLPQLIALIPVVSTGVGDLIAFISSIRTAASQTSQWTPALEAQFVNALIAKGSTNAWMTDSQVAAAKAAAPPTVPPVA
jgi:hypothetical protein